MQEFDEELRETRLVWDVIGIGEVRRREECFTTLQSGHLLYHYKGNNGQVGFLTNRKWKDIMRVNSINPRAAELVLCIIIKTQQIKDCAYICTNNIILIIKYN